MDKNGEEDFVGSGKRVKRGKDGQLPMLAVFPEESGTSERDQVRVNVPRCIRD